MKCGSDSHGGLCPRKRKGRGRPRRCPHRARAPTRSLQAPARMRQREKCLGCTGRKDTDSRVRAEGTGTSGSSLGMRVQAATAVPLFLLLYSPCHLAGPAQAGARSLSTNLANPIWPTQPASPQWLPTSHTSHTRASLLSVSPSSAQATTGPSSCCSSYQVVLSLAQEEASLSLHRISHHRAPSPARAGAGFGSHHTYSQAWNKRQPA